MTVTTPACVLVERHGNVALLRLNRPEKRNAVNEQMSAEASDALDAFEADESVRCIVVAGTGDKAFCAGQDMAEAAGRVPRSGDGRGGGANGLARRLASCAKPVVGAINGFCYGGGLSVALGCDVRLAADTATFRLPGASYGLVVSATWLTSVVGPAAAKDLTFTARTFDAQEALRIGLVSRVVPFAELERAVLEYAEMITANSPLAIGHAKRIINAAAVSAAAYEQEMEVNKLLRGGDDNVSRFQAAADRVLKQR